MSAAEVKPKRRWAAASLGATPLLALSLPLVLTVLVWAWVVAFRLPAGTLVVVNGRYAAILVPRDPGMAVLCAASFVVASVLGMLLASTAVLARMCGAEIGLWGCAVRLAAAWKRVLPALLPVVLAWFAALALGSLALRLTMWLPVVLAMWLAVFMFTVRLLFAVPIAIVQQGRPFSAIANGWRAYGAPAQYGPGFMMAVALFAGSAVIVGANWVAERLDGTPLGIAGGLAIRAVVAIAVLLLLIELLSELVTNGMRWCGWHDDLERFGAAASAGATAEQTSRLDSPADPATRPLKRRSRGPSLLRAGSRWLAAVTVLLLPALFAGAFVAVNPGVTTSVLAADLARWAEPDETIPFRGGRSLTLIGGYFGTRTVQLCGPRECRAATGLFGRVSDVAAMSATTAVVASWERVRDTDENASEPADGGYHAELQLASVHLDDLESAIAQAEEASRSEQEQNNGTWDQADADVDLDDVSALWSTRSMVRRIEPSTPPDAGAAYNRLSFSGRIAVVNAGGAPVIATIPPQDGYDQPDQMLELYRCDDLACASPTRQEFPLSRGAGDSLETSIDFAVGDDGTAYVSIMRPAEQGRSLQLLRIAPDGSFTDQVLDGQVGTWISLDEDDRMSLAVHDRVASLLYRDADGSVRLVHCDDRECSHWSSVPVARPPEAGPDESYPGPLSLVVDATGRPMFTGQGPRGVTLVSCEDTSCTKRTERALGIQKGTAASLALDERGLPVIAVRVYEPGEDHEPSVRERQFGVPEPAPSSVVHCEQRRCGAR